MSRISLPLLILRLLVISSVLVGCAVSVQANLQTTVPEVSPTMVNTSTISPTPFLAITNTPIIIPPTYTPLPTFTPSPTNTPLPTDTPVPTNTPEPVYNPAGYVIAPILLYHHISDVSVGNRYFVTPDVFRAQLHALQDWGYTSITITELVNVIINGGDLPARPVVLTFDDGNNDIYQYAFPIMQEMGFVGTFYIVGNRLQSRYFVTTDQIREMAAAGWEIGDHSMSHIDLTLDHSVVGYEAATSRSVLEEALGVSINTFAYPYGLTDEFVTNKISEYGYHAAVGLGRSWEHSWGTLFYLSRIEIEGSYDMAKFASILPWSN